MDNSIVRLVWDHTSPKETNLHITADEGVVLHIVLERKAVSHLEDAMISFIGGTQPHSDSSIIYVIANAIHEGIGDRGMDAVLSGMAIIAQKMDNDSQGEMPCEKTYTYSCDNTGEVEISHE